MNKKLILAYTAGFFDGEGSINILKRKRVNWNPEYTLMVAIGQKDGATLDWIKDNYGGSVHLVKRDKSFYWAVSNKKAETFLHRIYPYLQYKKPQADTAFKFYDERKRQTKPITQEELLRRENLRIEMKMLKKNIIISKYTGSETKRIEL